MAEDRDSLAERVRELEAETERLRGVIRQGATQPDVDDLEAIGMSRRDALRFLGLGGLAILSSGTVSAATSDHSAGFAHLLGLREARPSAPANTRWLYFATNNQTIYFSTWGTEGWNTYGTIGTGGGVHDVSDDGTLVDDAPTEVNFAAGLTASDPDNDGVVDVNLHVRQEEDTFTMAAATSDTVTVSFANTYLRADGQVGVDEPPSTLVDVSAEWKQWVRDADGDIVGMEIVYNNSSTNDQIGRWNVMGEVAP